MGFVAGVAAAGFGWAAGQGRVVIQPHSRAVARRRVVE